MEFAVWQQKKSSGPTWNSPACRLNVPHLLCSEAKSQRIIEERFNEDRIGALVLVDEFPPKLIPKAGPRGAARGVDHFESVMRVAAFQLPKTNAPLNGSHGVSLPDARKRLIHRALKKGSIKIRVLPDNVQIEASAACAIK